jgi:hypothetical protein
MNRQLKDLPEITESKLRELEKVCTNTDDAYKVKLYYTASRNLYDAGYDSRHHIASAYGLLKKLSRVK